MSKNTRAKTLPRKVQNNLTIMGQQIKLARKRRKLSLACMAERTQCSELTLMRAERGEPSVSIGIYARILYGLGLDEDLLLIARKDEAGNALVNSRIIRRNDHNDDDYDVFD